ncbi:hypothetical protein [uncultured Acetobacteroides sp.]|uniref:hypothetical protein n=1 Tax=uncultured Acetobacteroides sp. TaxID=1760811 RepID=UPI0029F547E0|nr:hypothetical protein [uncultured Acetobacteroides sp.]
MALSTQNTNVANTDISTRANIGKNVIYFSLITVSVLGLAVIITVGFADETNTTMVEKKFSLIRDTFTMLLPVFGTWVGTVLAFYFSRENFVEAAKQTAALVKQLTPEQQLEKIPVTEAMISLEDINAVKLVLTKTEDQIKLWDDIILAVLNKTSKNRLPILDNQGRVKYIVHRSIIDKYLAEQALAGNQNVKNCTLKDLITSNDYGNIATSFGVVGKITTLAAVKQQIDGNPNCSDVFVTEDGTKNSRATGWITNVIVNERSKV